LVSMKSPYVFFEISHRHWCGLFLSERQSEDDNEVWNGKKMEDSNCVLFQGTTSAFVWRIVENHETF
jgi:hypothetical protein